MRLLAIGDLHCGSLWGLTPPGYRREDAPWADTLWRYYCEALADNGPYDAVIANGDLIDGPGRKETDGHLTTDIGKQTRMAVTALQQTGCDRMYIIRGTGYHTDHGGALEDYVADAIGAQVSDELRLEVYGRKLHVRHVVGRSDTPYGQQTQLAKEQVNDILRGVFDEYEDADVIIRSHVHYCVRSGVADGARGIVREAITLPALQLRGPGGTAFTRRLRTWLYHVGITTVDIDEAGRVDIRPHIFPIRLFEKREYECLTPTQSQSRSQKKSKPALTQ